MAYDKHRFKKLTKVIGSPEENSIWMVKEVLKDMGLSCSKCGQAYQSPEDQERLGLSLTHNQIIEPEGLRVKVGCACGHTGEISLRPNPLIVQNAIGYGITHTHTFHTHPKEK